LGGGVSGGDPSVDAKQFLIDFDDLLAPTLDTYEQAIYLHVFRHSLLVGENEVVLSVRSLRSRMGETTCYEKLRSLQKKGCLDVITSERTGTRLRLRPPSEIPGIIRPVESTPVLSLEQMDFFEIEENRELILAREGHKCFYCLCNLNADNYVVEHVVSRPVGDNGYRNIVASCRRCNNRKGDSDVEDFLRVLYREGLLSGDDLEQRLSHLQRLRNGELRPLIIDAT
jgi:hypothetical protein